MLFGCPPQDALCSEVEGLICHSGPNRAREAGCYESSDIAGWSSARSQDEQSRPDEETASSQVNPARQAPSLLQGELRRPVPSLSIQPICDRQPKPATSAASGCLTR